MKYLFLANACTCDLGLPDLGSYNVFILNFLGILEILGKSHLGKFFKNRRFKNVRSIDPSGNPSNLSVCLDRIKND